MQHDNQWKSRYKGVIILNQLYSVDRFEGNFAILEKDNMFFTVYREKLPLGIAEGDLLDRTEQGWQICKNETEQKRRALAERRNRMLRKFS